MRWTVLKSPKIYLEWSIFSSTAPYTPFIDGDYLPFEAERPSIALRPPTTLPLARRPKAMNKRSEAAIASARNAFDRALATNGRPRSRSHFK